MIIAGIGLYVLENMENGTTFFQSFLSFQIVFSLDLKLNAVFIFAFFQGNILVGFECLSVFYIAETLTIGVPV